MLQQEVLEPPQSLPKEDETSWFWPPKLRNSETLAALLAPPCPLSFPLSPRSMLYAPCSMMCGIAGIISRTPLPPDRALLERMADALQHRGPDDSGTEISGSVGFAFRRLAILDLSPAGHQPMVSHDGNYCVVMNGEIYNFVELREKLERCGHVFRGHSDTEVLLELYARYGTEMFRRLNGMFALALHDREKRLLILARDRIGKKPLFYWNGPPGFSFASETRALRQLPGFPSDLNPEALGMFVRLGWIPNSHCIYPGVRKLPPAAWVAYDCDTGRLGEPTAYWELPPLEFDTVSTEHEWIERIDELLTDATRIRLRSDVPLGVFLSGGIDSGLVAASAVRAQPELTALTIGFDEEEYDETELASATARHLGCRHIQRKLRLSDAQRLLPEVMGHFDEPFADSSALPTNLVCAEARKELTVVLSGDGGDEVFGGYPSHLRAWRWRHVDLIPLTLRRVCRRLLVQLGPDDSRWRRFMQRFGEPVGSFGLGGHSYAFQDWQDRFIVQEFNLPPERLIELVLASLPQSQDRGALDQAQRLDLRLYLRDDGLVKVDRTSMKHALEVRSPLLDHRLVELAFQVPPRLRVLNGETKHLLRRLAAKRLPSTVASGPKKGFGIPLHTWFFGSNGTPFKELIMSHDSHFPDLFQPGGAEQLWKAAERNPVLDPALFEALAYRCWCNAQR